MEDQFEINFQDGEKKYAGDVYPDHSDNKIYYQLHFHLEGDGVSSIIFMERGEQIDRDPQAGWVQRIAEGEQPFLSAEFLQAAGAAIEIHDRSIKDKN